MHITEKEVPKVQEGFGRADADREGRFCNSPLQYSRGRRDGWWGTREQSRVSGQPRHASTGMVGQPPALTLPCSPRRGPG